jgi:hypothetical protein
MAAKKTRSKRMVSPEHRLFEKHTGHQSHLCDLVSRRKMAQVAKLSKGARYICHICGRAAAKSSSVCEPVEI